MSNFLHVIYVSMSEIKQKKGIPCILPVYANTPEFISALTIKEIRSLIGRVS